MVSKIKELFGSRKFYVGLIGSVIVYVNSQVHIMDDTQIMSLSAIIGSWILGQGLVDSKK